MTFMVFTGFSIPALAGAGDGLFLRGQDRSAWQAFISSGLDAYVHTYSLSTSDTTESLAEFMISGGVTGRSSRKARHRWRLRGDASAGTELFRENLEAEYRFQGPRGQTRWRLNGQWRARQYRDTSEYRLTSDNHEGRLDFRAYPWTTPSTKLELRGWSGFMDHSQPSTLEVDHFDKGAGVFVKSSGLDLTQWSVGSRASFRAYPDSTDIDRRTLSLEGQLDTQDLDGQSLRLYHKTGRRKIREEQVRPSAWSHWSDLSGKATAGSGWIFADIQSEVWRYDHDFSAYYDSWRLKTVVGYSWGDILATIWRMGLASEKLWAKDSPDAYTEFGLRAGAEAYGGDVGGSLSLEIGQRFYDNGSVDLSEGFTADTSLISESYDLYTNFMYWEIWLSGNWALSDQLSLDVLASYEPENHTEKEDDSALGFATIRLVYRP